MGSSPRLPLPQPTSDSPEEKAEEAEVGAEAEKNGEGRSSAAERGGLSAEETDQLEAVFAA